MPGHPAGLQCGRCHWLALGFGCESQSDSSSYSQISFLILLGELSAPNLGVCCHPDSIASALHVQPDMLLLVQVLACLLDPERVKPHPTSAETPLGCCLITLTLLSKTQRRSFPSELRQSSSLGGRDCSCFSYMLPISPYLPPSPAQGCLQTTYSPYENVAASS